MSDTETSRDDRIFLVVVDESPEMRAALRFACGRARRTGGRVGLLRVFEPADFQHWAAVGNLMREESRADAERLLMELAGQVYEQHGEIPIFFVKEGEQRDALLELIEEEPNIRILVLAAAVGTKGPGPLISFLAKRTIGRLRIPLTIVPGSLTDEQIDALT